MKVSIIVPMYNCDNHIEQCLSSLVNQDYTNTEIVLVNNNSSDNTLYIANKYKETYDNVVLVNCTKQGVSYARNLGLKQCTGDFLTFVDADDYCSFNHISILMKYMVEGGLTINAFKMGDDIDYSFSPSKMWTNDIKEIHKKNIFEELLKYDSDIKPTVWGKMFDMDIVRKYDIIFNPDVLIGEDFLFLMNYINKVENKIFYINKVCYYYRVHSNSAMNNRKITKENLLKFKTELVMLSLIESYVQTEEQERLINIRLFDALFELIKMTRFRHLIFTKEESQNLEKKIIEKKSSDQYGINIKTHIKIELVRIYLRKCIK